ncbi:hypothetical protein [Nocardioides immobilis]|uniref:hypothetical protein n=1 Tax=Nocardioides immobilis TaxID=2049295 RepID=UPI0011C36CDB|nr:hypothetical protein [Nocardioides immobilis]
MTQSAAAPPAVQQAPPPPAPAPQRRGFWPAPTGKPVGAGVEDTPSLLNRLQIIGMTVVLLFGLASALIQFLSYQSDGRAADDTEQLVRVQEIQSSLLRADALATNAFLEGGDEDPEKRGEYDDTIAVVFEQIAEAAEAQSADRDALKALVVVVNRYANYVAEARVYNRQGFPVGAEYLSVASDSVRTEAQPILGNLVTANTDRAEDSMAGQHPFWLLLLGLVVLGVLVWLNLLLAQRFRRYLNVGVAIAAAIVVVTTLVAAIAAWRADSTNDGLLDDELQVAIDESAARTAGNDAKAYESLRLIKRGSGGTYEPKWEDAAEIVEKKADSSSLDEWEDYVDGHRQIATLDDDDQWFRARNIAIDEAATSPTANFDRFDGATQAVVTENGTTTTDELRSGRTLALIGSLLTLILGFVAAVAVARGIGARRKEYA